MIKAKQKILFLFLVIFSIYCALVIGQGWDEETLITQGKIAINYLLSLGKIDIDIFRREYYSPIYYSLKFLLIQIFPIKYHIEASHMINLAFSLGAIIGIKKIGKELFNENVGKIVFLILFFYPIFFGHMALNSKDTIIAFSHVWIFYLLIQYVKKQNIKLKANSHINFIAVLAALGSGINLFFLGSLIPIFLFLLIDILFVKKFACKNFSKKKFLIDIAKGFVIFYFLLVLFWIDTHPNIFVLPFNLFLEWVIGDFWRGYPYILVNGNYFLYGDIPKSYLFINLLYKSPEYFLLTYLIFLFIFLKSNNFFKRKFYDFNYKFLLMISMIIFPFLLMFFTPFSIYDGLRHVLWMLPYFCIIPALTIYYLIENIKFFFAKVTLSLISLLIIYFLFNFFLLTPYQYTYLNIFNGKVENRYKKFENDYWGSSARELIKKIDLNKKSTITFATCGIGQNVAKHYLKKNGYSNFKFGNSKNSSYIIMTNRVILNEENIWKTENLINCYDKFKGEDVFSVTRNGIILSVVRKIN
tara:strand:- start:6417 stop:7997 length:1581 start_codon:yes stop_codon:yes gene_type:complete